MLKRKLAHFKALLKELEEVDGTLSCMYPCAQKAPPYSYADLFVPMKEHEEEYQKLKAIKSKIVSDLEKVIS